MTTQPKILLLSSGGDSPGMNAAIRAAVRSAIHVGIEIVASEMGFIGLVNEEIQPLNNAYVANIIQRGGTVLKTGRCEEFRDPSVRAKCIKFLKKEHIDVIIVLGGDGSFAGATLMAREGGPGVIGIPCTIDNDVNGTQYCIGFDTARNTALAAIDKIRDTAFSHERNFMIEVMGRESGFLAVDVGISGGAEIILTPEFPLSTDELINKIQRKRREKLASIIVVAEAGRAGHTIQLANDIQQRSGIKYRICILGHTQRGGTPTLMDRKIASIMGARAIEAIQNGQTNKMMSMQNDKVVLTDFPPPENATRFFSDHHLLEMNEIICDMHSNIR